MSSEGTKGVNSAVVVVVSIGSAPDCDFEALRKLAKRIAAVITRIAQTVGRNMDLFITRVLRERFGFA